MQLTIDKAAEMHIILIRQQKQARSRSQTDQ